MELAKQHQAIGAERRSMVGSGDRSEKIRTYNFPQNRLTDHRIGLTLHQLNLVMEGKMEPIVEALTAHDQSKKLGEQPKDPYLQLPSEPPYGSHRPPSGPTQPSDGR
jgi:peptide chain release factor 1